MFFPLAGAVLLVGTLVAAPVLAAPAIPWSDDVVLERLPESRDPSIATLKKMRSLVRAAPQDLRVATLYARRAVDASRATGDPRYLGQAQAALQPWWSADDPPSPALLLRATIKQSLHDFDGALADLDRLLARAPDDAQARLTRATVRSVVGPPTRRARTAIVSSARSRRSSGPHAARPPMHRRGERSTPRSRRTRHRPRASGPGR